MPKLPLIDYLGLAWFILCWAGYTYFAYRKSSTDPSLVVAMRRYRHEWFTRMLDRDNRVGDVVALGSLLTSATFFASTSLLILSGLVAMLGTTEQVIDMVAELPFTRRESELAWDVKIILLIVTFVYAFFKFTWAIRQFNFCTILAGAGPQRTDPSERHEEFVNMITNVASFSAENHNQGLRAYYFALAALTWFLNPWLFVLSSALVAYVLYQREFHSRTLYALIRPAAVKVMLELPENKQPRWNSLGRSSASPAPLR